MHDRRAPAESERGRRPRKLARALESDVVCCGVRGPRELDAQRRGGGALRGPRRRGGRSDGGRSFDVRPRLGHERAGRLSAHDPGREVGREHLTRRAEDERLPRHEAEQRRHAIVPAPGRRHRRPAGIRGRVVADAPHDPGVGIESPRDPRPPAVAKPHPPPVVERGPAPGVVAHPDVTIFVRPVPGAGIGREVGPNFVRAGDPNRAVRRVVDP